MIVQTPPALPKGQLGHGGLRFAGRQACEATLPLRGALHEDVARGSMREWDEVVDSNQLASEDWQHEARGLGPA